MPDCAMSHMCMLAWQAFLTEQTPLDTNTMPAKATSNNQFPVNWPKPQTHHTPVTHHPACQAMFCSLNIAK